MSHFRPWVDSIRAAFMHLRLVAVRLLPFNPRRGPTVAGDADPPQPLWRRLVDWLSPRQAWRQLKQDRPEGAKRTAAAGGLAIGAFIGCLPTYGAHALIALYTAKRLNLNPLAMVLGTQVAFPPLGIVLAIVAVGIGHLLRFGRIPPPEEFAPLWEGWAGIVQLGTWFFIDWAIGSVVVGIIMMFAVFFIADALLRRLPVDESHGGGSPAAPETHPTAAS